MSREGKGSAKSVYMKGYIMARNMTKGRLEDVMFLSHTNKKKKKKKKKMRSPFYPKKQTKT